MSAEVAREIGGYLVQQLEHVSDGSLMEAVLTASLIDRDLLDQDVASQLDRARRWAVALDTADDELWRRISLANLIVDEMLDHAPEECSCDMGRVCVWHRLDDVLRGVER